MKLIHSQTQMTMRGRIALIFMMLAFASSQLFAQDTTWGDDGEVEDAEIIIEKDKKLELPKFNKYYEKIKFDQAEAGEIPVKFDVKDLSFSPVVKPSKIKVLKLKPQALEKVYNGQVQLGYGNFNSPFVDVIYSNKRDENLSIGAHVNHHSFGKGPVDDKNSASGSTLAELFVKGYAKEIGFYSSLGFQNRFNHFYGYSPEITTPLKDTINQRFNEFDFVGGFNGTNQESPFKYNYDVAFNTISDNFNASENTFSFNGKNNYQINDDWNAGINVAGSLSTYEDLGLSLERNQFKVSPFVRFKLSEFLIQGGFNVVAAVDSTNQDSELAIYPDFNVAFPISEYLDIYGGIRGDQDFNTFSSFSNANPWIQNNLDIRNEITKFELYGGLRGKISETVGVTAGFSTGTYENIGFFVNSQPDSSRFDLIYDTGNTAVFRLFGELNYSFGEKAGVQANAEIIGYDTDQLPEAWHMPQYKMSISGNYRLINKLIFRPQLEVIGGIEGYNAASDIRQKLDPIVNLNLRSRYILSERSGLFLNLDNILGSDNQMFMNYPSRALQFQVGFSYSF